MSLARFNMHGISAIPHLRRHPACSGPNFQRRRRRRRWHGRHRQVRFVLFSVLASTANERGHLCREAVGASAGGAAEELVCEVVLHVSEGDANACVCDPPQQRVYFERCMYDAGRFDGESAGDVAAKGRRNDKAFGRNWREGVRQEVIRRNAGKATPRVRSSHELLQRRHVVAMARAVTFICDEAVVERGERGRRVWSPRAAGGTGWGAAEGHRDGGLTCD